jgi:hypothetical protein
LTEVIYGKEIVCAEKSAFLCWSSKIKRRPHPKNRREGRNRSSDCRGRGGNTGSNKNVQPRNLVPRRRRWSEKKN